MILRSIDNLDDMVTYTENMKALVRWDASVAGLSVGDKVSYRDLLYPVFYAFSILRFIKISLFLCKFFINFFRFFLDILPHHEYNNIRWFARNDTQQKTLPNCVKVARQTLTLFVRVRILLRLPHCPETLRFRVFLFCISCCFLPLLFSDPNADPNGSG